MYCPQCKAEYREGFTKCSDCHVALVPKLPPKAPEPGFDAIVAFESDDRRAVAAAKEILETAEIPFLTYNDEVAVRSGWSAIHLPWCQFLVPEPFESCLSACCCCLFSASSWILLKSHLL